MLTLPWAGGLGGSGGGGAGLALLLTRFRTSSGMPAVLSRATTAGDMEKSTPRFSMASLRRRSGIASWPIIRITCSSVNGAPVRKESPVLPGDTRATGCAPTKAADPASSAAAQSIQRIFRPIGSLFDLGFGFLRVTDSSLPAARFGICRIGRQDLVHQPHGLRVLAHLPQPPH